MLKSNIMLEIYYHASKTDRACSVDRFGRSTSNNLKQSFMLDCRSSNIFDNMLAIMEKYANTLESLVDERTLQLAQEKKTTETLLLRMLPKYALIARWL